jgi:hypothetical protein
MEFLRRVVGKTRRRRTRNTNIRGELKMEEILSQIKVVGGDGLDMLREWMSTEYQQDYCD